MAVKQHPWSCLVTLRSHDGHYTHIIGKQGFTVGRSSESDLPIVDPRVSRNHLTVELDGEFVYIKDQESANGTFVNENQLAAGERKIVRAEDVVRLGKYTGKLQFRAIPTPFEMMQKGSYLNYKTAVNEFSAELEKNVRIAVEKEFESTKAKVKKQAAEVLAVAERQADNDYEECLKKCDRQLEATAKKCEEQLGSGRRKSPSDWARPTKSASSKSARRKTRVRN